jgi:Spy/CpxP family protein refolding chaperone
MKTLSKYFLMTLAMVTMISVQAQPGQGPRDGQGRGNGPRDGQWMDKMQLTEDQKTQIDELRTAHWAGMQELQAELKIKEAELDAAMIKQDNKSAKALVATINSLRGELFSNKINHQLAVKELLNDDQKLLFDQFVLNRENRGKGDGPRAHGPHAGNRPARGGRQGNK